MEQTPEKSKKGHQESVLKEDLVAKFISVAQGPDAGLLLNLLDILYERLTELDYDDQHLSAEDLDAIRQGQEDIKQGRCLALEEYRGGKSL